MTNWVGSVGCDKRSPGWALKQTLSLTDAEPKAAVLVRCGTKLLLLLLTTGGCMTVVGARICVGVETRVVFATGVVICWV